MKDDNYMLVFTSHNQAAFLYEKLCNRGFDIKIVSTPCKISSGCSQSIKLKGDVIKEALKESSQNGINIRAVYKIIIDEEGEHYSLEQNDMLVKDN